MAGQDIEHAPDRNALGLDATDRTTRPAPQRTVRRVKRPTTRRAAPTPHPGHPPEPRRPNSNSNSNSNSKATPIPTTSIPGLSAVRLIVAAWLAVLLVVRLGFLASGDAGWAIAPMALVVLSFAAQSLFVIYGRRLHKTPAGWLVTTAQFVLTYLPFALFGRDWMAGNSGMLVGALLLTAGPLAGLPLAVGVAAADVVLSTSVLHTSGFAMLVYPITATLDNGVQFWGLVTLAHVVEDLHTERRELARLAAADERSRAERALRTAFGHRLLTIERHVSSALQDLTTDPESAQRNVATAACIARECQQSVRSAAEGPLLPVATVGVPTFKALIPTGSTPTSSITAPIPAEPTPTEPHPAGPHPESKMQLIVVAALGLLLLNYNVQAVADAADDQTHSVALTVLGFAAVIFAGIAALRHHQRERSVVGPQAATLLRAVTLSGLIIFPIALTSVVLLITPPLGAWIGFVALGISALVLQTRTGPSWRRLLTLVILAMALSLTLAPISDGSLGTGVYLLAGAAAIAIDTYGMVRLVQLEGTLLRTRQQAVTLAALRERTRVARDVHDLLGLGITAIVLKTELASRLLTSDPGRARQHLEEVRRLVHESAESAGPIIGESADTTLTSEVHRAERTLAEAGIALDVRVDPVPQKTDAILAVILREAITNILRHSTASKARITLTAQGNLALFTVENDGASGEPTPTPTPTGQGLKNIGSRVIEAGGDLATSRTDGGFRLSVNLPM